VVAPTRFKAPFRVSRQWALHRPTEAAGGHLLFEPPRGHEHQRNAVAVLEALGPLPPAIRPAALSIPRSTATTATGEQKYPLLLRNSARRSYTKRTSLERISRGRTFGRRTFGRRTSTGLNSAEPISAGPFFARRILAQPTYSGLTSARRNSRGPSLARGESPQGRPDQGEPSES
jgi:hypothetical protein